MDKIQISKPLIKYRKAVKSDIPYFVEQRLIYLDDLEKDESKEIEPELKRRTIQYFINNIQEKKLIIIIAENKGTPVGWGCLVIREEPPYFGLPDGKTGYIFNMYTLSDYRNIGIGTKILKQLVNKGKIMGLTKFELNTTEQGKSLYTKFGFGESKYPLMEFRV